MQQSLTDAIMMLSIFALIQGGGTFIGDVKHCWMGGSTETTRVGLNF